MPPLSDIQSNFARAVTQPGHQVPEGVTSHSGARPLKRFNVYRNNIAMALREILRGVYPVVSRLVGEEFFSALARAYIEKHPPRSPVLMEYGGAFPEFLESFKPVADLPYLADVARIEWAWHQAYYAQDAVPLTADDLSGTPERDIPNLRLACHPSLSIVTSKWPVLSIWQTNTEDETVKPVNLEQGGEDVLVLRPEMTVQVRRIPPGGAAFLAALLEGEALGRAADIASETAADFSFEANLAGLITSGAFVAYASTA